MLKTTMQTGRRSHLTTTSESTIAPVVKNVAAMTMKRHGQRVALGVSSTHINQQAVSSQASTCTKDTKSTSDKWKVKKKKKVDAPLATSFSNSRTATSSQLKGSFKQNSKIPEKKLTRNQNLIAQNFSATHQEPSISDSRDFSRPTIAETCHYSVVPRQIEERLSHREFQSSTSDISDQFAKAEEDMETVQVGRSSQSSSCGSEPQQCDYRSSSDESDGEVEASLVIAPPKQVPRVVTQFTNIFKHDFQRAHESKEVNQKDQQDEKKKKFEIRQLSPSRVKDRLLFQQIQSKVLPTISVADITRSDQQSLFHLRNLSSGSSVPLGGECSVPNIFTNSSQSLSLDQKRNSELFSQNHLESDISYSSHINVNTSNTLQSSLQTKFVLNLEIVIVQELKLWSIGEFMKNHINEMKWPQKDLMMLCEEWWAVTKDSSSLFDLYKIYGESRTRKVLRKAMILECVAVVVSAYLNQVFAILPEDSSSIAEIFSKVHEIAAQAHQNLLQIVCMILQRMGPDACKDNMWAITLKNLISQKCVNHSKGSALDVLELSDERRDKILSRSSAAIIKEIHSVESLVMKLYQGTLYTGPSIIFTNIAFILQEIEKIHITKVRDMLVQALGYETMMIQQRCPIQQSWQEIPVDEGLECDESINLAPFLEEENPNQKQHLSTINEGDCSNSSFEDQIAPILPPMTPNRHYTLVLDLDETLIHYIEPEDSEELGGQFFVRPGARQFLKDMSKHFEIVIFTAALQEYADWVLNQLDTEHCISHRLYRHHAQQHGNYYIKDLKRLGRDLSKVVIVDNVAENFQLQPDNGVFIRTWLDDPNDNALLELAPLLKQIAARRVKDVRQALSVFRRQMMEQVSRGILKPQLSLDELDEDPDSI